MGIKVDVWFINEYDLMDTEFHNKWTVDVSNQVCEILGGIRTISNLFYTKPTQRQIRRVVKSSIKQLG